ncbi:MAG: chemotaxis protein CheD [Campylobacteraceae bacterium]|jgi:chemotaxis protein CheD|nr:chemotaxis protein CheD [Campylobacteraceae bacterium]
MYEKIFIHVGQIHIGFTPTEISTVLGSCVAVCLFDKYKMIGGMNHYLLPLWNGNGLQSPKFGNVSVPRMIQSMMDIGCNPSNMEAKIFGGASINISSSEDMMIGKRNVLTAKEILDEYKIPVVAEDTGGAMGRRIMMRSDTGKVFMKYTG